MKIRSVPKVRPGRRKARSAAIVTPAVTEADALVRAGTGPDRGRLRVEPARVRGAADRTAALRARAGGPLLDRPRQDLPTDEEQYVVAVDPMAVRLGPKINEDLLCYEEVVAASGTDQAAHGAHLKRVEAAGGACLNAEERLREVDDSLRVVADSNRALRRDLRVAIPTVLDSGTLAPAAASALQTIWRRIQEEEAKAEERAAATLKEGATRDEATRVEVARTDRRAELVRTMLDLRTGRPVGRARTARAGEALAEIGESDADSSDRRDRGR